MLVQVRHSTRYSYSHPVELGVHRFYLHPQFRQYFEVQNRTMTIAPNPNGATIRQDLVGNWYEQAWFTGKTSLLEIQSNLVFKIIPFNPFAFIVEGAFEDLFFNEEKGLYGEETIFLKPYLKEGWKEAPGFLRDIKSDSSGLIDFLTKVTGGIHQNWTHIIRHEQNVWRPSDTFSKKEGSCRDLAYLEMAMLQSLGLGSRFVSGYAFNPDVEDGHELHAWLEVYLPGAGWVGLDPSLGLFTDNGYIPLASHFDPQKTSPVQGVFFGDAQSKLETDVQIDILKS